MPRKKTTTQRVGEWLIKHHVLVTYTAMAVVFIVMLMVLQANAQADFLMKYGSG